MATTDLQNLKADLLALMQYHNVQDYFIVFSHNDVTQPGTTIVVNDKLAIQIFENTLTVKSQLISMAKTAAYSQIMKDILKSY